MIPVDIRELYVIIYIFLNTIYIIYKMSALVDPKAKLTKHIDKNENQLERKETDRSEQM